MRKRQFKRAFNGTFSIITVLFLLCISGTAQAGERDIYQIKIYSIDNEQQGQRMDIFLKDAYIPALHRAGITKVGVFKPVEEEEMAGKLIYVLIPFKNISQYEKLEAKLFEDEKFLTDGADYIDAAHDNTPYARIESIILRAFSSMPGYAIPAHTSLPSQQVYELRSYQSATEKLHHKKVEMFNEGGESKIFMKLGFQPVFFGEVMSGSSMPNLMYMTSFEDKDSQAAHWKAFGSSPDWKALSGKSEYDNTVSKIEKIYLHPAEYSEL